MGGHEAVFPLRRHEPAQLRLALAAVGRGFPVYERPRRMGDERPYKSAAAARDLHTLLVCAIGERDADGRSFYSWRATFASALFAE